MDPVISFTGCIGKLMTNSGLEKLMSCAFVGVNKMLIGKKFPNQSTQICDFKIGTGLRRRHV